MRASFLLLTLVSSSALAQAQLQGTLEERVDSAGYSYLKVKTSLGEQWAAVPQTNVEVGKPVTIDVQAQMKDFESKSLKRKWAVIAFGTLAGAAPQPGAVANPHEAGLPKSSPATAPLDGAVLEVIDAGTYTYLRLKTAAGETWAAVPKATVIKGAEVRISNPQPMDGFQSPTLKRTFEHIVFGTLGQR